MKKRFFWVALGLIGVSWLLNSMYAYSKQLIEPIFLDHYIDVSYQDNLYTTFYYLTNKNDKSVITSMTAGEVMGYPEQPYSFDGSIQNNQSFNNHVLRSVQLMFHLDPTSQTKDYSFTEMDVVFSDGKRITAPIGHVMIQSSTIDGSPLEQTSSSSSNDNSGQAWYRAIEPLAVETIDSSFKDLLQDDFFIKINTPISPLESKSPNAEFLDSIEKEWQDIPGLNVQDVSFPIHLKELDTLSVHSKFPANSKAVLDVNIYISGTTESGKAFSTTAGHIVQPYLEQKDVNEIIKEKTKGDADG